MLPADDIELPDQAWLRDRGQHRDAILRTLAVSYQNLIRPKIDILDPQLYGFEQPQTGSIEQQHNETRGAIEARQHAKDLIACQNDRKMRRSLRADHVVEPGQLLLEDDAIEKQER